MSSSAWSQFTPLDANYNSSPSPIDGRNETPQEINAWSQFTPLAPPQERFSENPLMSAARTLYQPLGGAADVTPYGIATNLWDLLGTGEALAAFDELDDYRIAELKERFPEAPWGNYEKLSKEEYLKNLEEARSTLPTIANIEKFLESQTGLPMEPKTFLQKVLRLGGSGFKLRPGTVGKKVTAGAATGAFKAALEQAGVPEQLSDILALGGGNVVPGLEAKVQVKPSGLPKRWYEKIKEPTKLSPSDYTKVVEAVEKDVKGLIDPLILQESRTARALEADPNFASKIDNVFKEVEKIASSRTEKIPSDLIKRSLNKEIRSPLKKGISPSEYEKVYRKELKKLSKEIPFNEFSIQQAYEQYRKNNKSARGYYEPGASKDFNRGKRDALSTYNKAIGEAFEKVLPDSEFNRLFKFSNKRFSELKDLERIDEFFNKTFKDGKINYKEAKSLFKNESLERSFKNTLGEKSYKDLQGILDDFVSTEKSMSLLKKGEELGVKDLAKYAKKWAISSWWAKGAALKDMSMGVRNSLLSNPQFRLEWKNGLQNYKRGKFAKAVESFKKLDEMVEEESKNQKLSQIANQK
jgi:hypothetical protein